MNPIVKNGNKLRWKFENVKNLTNDGMFSEKVSIDGVDWKFKIRPWTGTTAKWLAIFLYYDSNNRNDKNWICEINAKYKLLNQIGNGKHQSKESKMCMKHYWYCRGYHDFIEWDKLISTDSGYIENDSIVVEIEFNFKYYDFSKPVPIFTDITMRIEETDFHLNRWVLCSKSEYFYDLFVNKKTEDTVIELDDIKATDLCYILASLNSFFDRFNEWNYKDLMTIAKKFGVSSFHYKCEQFLITCTGIRLIEKIKYAEENGYETLMVSCIESLKTGADIQNLHSNVMFSELKETTKLRIMQSFLDIY